jgi:hypothetical protein
MLIFLVVEARLRTIQTDGNLELVTWNFEPASQLAEMHGIHADLDSGSSAE